ncbi:DUF1896 domain-containing protein [Mucilaginibacter sp. SMC90]|uniref:DUF1896 family protein n=1 Tax=Mucilaginibacter sp. SMC90 TaxID=2929803 RepID=UPI001FB3F455|nr:DUF1896 family protein [Mucilaginibacter sp. SMC90]UOE51346.1 DUF1896 domain-containing protein [Mucilaginibacter sp. SMC90]
MERAMYNLLMEKLRAYIHENNPELLDDLTSQCRWSTYLEDKVSKVMPTVCRLLGEDKPSYAIEELAMNELTADLKPSRYNFLSRVVKEDFPTEHESLCRRGVMRYETIKLITLCKDAFEAFSFSAENENNPLLRHTIIVKIHEHFN